MKVLIWFLCILCFSIIKVAIESGAHIVLGGIPTALMFAGMCAAANALVKKWNERNV